MISFKYYNLYSLFIIHYNSKRERKRERGRGREKEKERERKTKAGATDVTQ
jgi:hypothetical protein